LSWFKALLIVIDIGPGDLTIIGIRDIRPQILFSGDIYTTTHVYDDIASIFRKALCILLMAMRFLTSSTDPQP